MKEKNYALNHFNYCGDFDARWSSSAMESQPQLGLLPERRSGNGFADCGGFDPLRQALTASRRDVPEGGERHSRDKC